MWAIGTHFQWAICLTPVPWTQTFSRPPSPPWRPRRARRRVSSRYSRAVPFIRPRGSCAGGPTPTATRSGWTPARILSRRSQLPRSPPGGEQAWSHPQSAVRDLSTGLAAISRAARTPWWGHEALPGHRQATGAGASCASGLGRHLVPVGRFLRAGAQGVSSRPAPLNWSMSCEGSGACHHRVDAERWREPCRDGWWGRLGTAAQAVAVSWRREERRHELSRASAEQNAGISEKPHSTHGH